MWRNATTLLVAVILCGTTFAEDHLLTTFGLSGLDVVSMKEAAHVRGHGYAVSTGSSRSGLEAIQAEDLAPGEAGAISESQIIASGLEQSAIRHITEVRLNSNFSSSEAPKTVGMAVVDIQLRSTGYATSRSH